VFGIELFAGHKLISPCILFQAIIDPGYNVIAIPFDKAQELYSHVKGAVPHAEYPNRWVSSLRSR
jgi:hypothetical protein